MLSPNPLVVLLLPLAGRLLVPTSVPLYWASIFSASAKRVNEGVCERAWVGVGQPLLFGESEKKIDIFTIK
jgi:hypothetical protein